LLRWSALVAAVVVAFIGGFFWQPKAVMPSFTMLDGNTESLMQQVRFRAQQNDRLEDTRQVPYRYTNIQFEPTSDHKISLRFDLVRPITMEVDRNDPLVGELLVHRLMSPTPVASRLEAVQLAGNQLAPKVREALIVTLMQDENFAVRERALQGLAPYIGDEKVSDAFLALLRSDANVQLRLFALDVLSKHPSSHASLQNIADEFDQPTDLPLLLELEQR
jgi:hypothetical protein